MSLSKADRAWTINKKKKKSRYSTRFFPYPLNWIKLNLTFILNIYQSFRSNCSLISGVSQDTETFKTGKEVKEWKWEWRKNCPHFHFETRQNFTIGKNNVWTLQFCSSRLCSSTAPQSRQYWGLKASSFVFWRSMCHRLPSWAGHLLSPQYHD